MEIITVGWLFSSVVTIGSCHLIAARSVKLNRNTYRKHPEWKPKNAFEWLTGRNYLRCKKANADTRNWYHLCLALWMMTITELLFILIQTIIIGGDMKGFFSWLADDMAGGIIAGLPLIVLLFVCTAARTGFEGLKRFLSEAICPVFAVLVAVIYVVLIPLLFVWRNSTF